MSAKDLIISLPNPNLRSKSQKVSKLDPGIKKIIEQMKAAALDWEDSRQHEIGVALAAIQVDQPYKIIIIRADFDDRADRTFVTLINPQITKLEGKIESDYEGCLSIPDIYGMVPRHSRVRLRAINEKGQEIHIKAEGFLARVLQHEVDHLKGTMFIDHIKNQPKAFLKLTKDGRLRRLNYEKDVKKNPILW